MIIIILALIGMFAGLLIKKGAASLFGAILGAGLGVFITLVVTVSKLDKAPWKITSSIPIYSLQDNSLTSGIFFLGGGSINEHPVYSYYIKGEFGYKLSYTYANYVEIVESETIPRIEKSRPMSTNTKPFYKTMFWFMYTASYRRTIIYVPKGTIIKNFRLDSNY